MKIIWLWRTFPTWSQWNNIFFSPKYYLIKCHKLIFKKKRECLGGYLRHYYSVKFLLFYIFPILKGYHNQWSLYFIIVLTVQFFFLVIQCIVWKNTNLWICMCIEKKVWKKVSKLTVRLWGIYFPFDLYLLVIFPQ